MGASLSEHLVLNASSSASDWNQDIFYNNLELVAFDRQGEDASRYVFVDMCMLFQSRETCISLPNPNYEHHKTRCEWSGFVGVYALIIFDILTGTSHGSNVDGVML